MTPRPSSLRRTLLALAAAGLAAYAGSAAAQGNPRVLNILN